MKNLHLVGLIEQWAEDRNLIKGSTPAKQCMKLISEFGELADNVGVNNLDKVKDAIGDVFVVATIVTRQLGDYLEQWIESELFEINGSYDNERLVIEAQKALNIFCDNAVIKSKFDYYETTRLIGILREIAKRFDLTLDECVEAAYNEIKDRKGIMHEGIFVKEKDSRYAEIVALHKKEIA